MTGQRCGPRFKDRLLPTLYTQADFAFCLLLPPSAQCLSFRQTGVTDSDTSRIRKEVWWRRKRQCVCTRRTNRGSSGRGSIDVHMCLEALYVFEKSGDVRLAL